VIVTEFIHRKDSCTFPKLVLIVASPVKGWPYILYPNDRASPVPWETFVPCPGHDCVLFEGSRMETLFPETERSLYCISQLWTCWIGIGRAIRAKPKWWGNRAPAPRVSFRLTQVTGRAWLPGRISNSNSTAAAASLMGPVQMAKLDGLLDPHIGVENKTFASRYLAMIRTTSSNAIN